MSFAWHHPSYYKKLKQNSGRSSSGSSKETVSEANLSPQTMETEKVGHVDRLSLAPHQPNLSSIHTDQKETKQ